MALATNEAHLIADLQVPEDKNANKAAMRRYRRIAVRRLDSCLATNPHLYMTSALDLRSLSASISR